MSERRPRIAIVDYGTGNLFSVRCACEQAGMDGTVTSNKDEIVSADAIILPGVGAFKDAMASLEALDLVMPLKDFAASGKPLFGVCLGMQLLMTESEEFGSHRGLDLVPGRVVRLKGGQHGGRRLKVPHVGWNRIDPPRAHGDSDRRPAAWVDTLLEDVAPGTNFYFVHSFHVEPADPSWVASVTPYGDLEFCSSLRRGNIFACQFHPERSGPPGLGIYRRLPARLISSVEERSSWK